MIAIYKVAIAAFVVMVVVAGCGCLTPSHVGSSPNPHLTTQIATQKPVVTQRPTVTPQQPRASPDTKSPDLFNTAQKPQDTRISAPHIIHEPLQPTPIPETATIGAR